MHNWKLNFKKYLQQLQKIKYLGIILTKYIYWKLQNAEKVKQEELNRHTVFMNWKALYNEDFIIPNDNKNSSKILHI